MHLWFINAGFGKLFLWRAKEAAVSWRDTCLLFWLSNLLWKHPGMIRKYPWVCLCSNNSLFQGTGRDTWIISCTPCKRRVRMWRKWNTLTLLLEMIKKHTHSFLYFSSLHNFIYVFCFWLDAYMPQSTCGVQRTESLQEMALSFHHMYLTIQLMSLGLVASTLTHWVTSLAILGIKWKHVFELPIICITLSQYSMILGRKC